MENKEIYNALQKYPGSINAISAQANVNRNTIRNALFVGRKSKKLETIRLLALAYLGKAEFESASKINKVRTELHHLGQAILQATS